MMKNLNLNCRHARAFTMVELMVVIVIVTVLSALVFALSVSARKKGSSAVSVSNLHQIGIAMSAYASENNNFLPGPILTDHFPTYQNNAVSGQLSWLLRDYLGSVPQPGNPKPRMFYAAILDYPAAKTGAKDQNGGQKPTYVVNTRPADAVTAARYWPLGNYNPNSAGNKTPPMTTSQMASRRFRGTPWITEIDQVIRPSSSRYGAEKVPPHGNYRNSLMFDFSVRAVPLGEFGSSW